MFWFQAVIGKIKQLFKPKKASKYQSNGPYRTVLTESIEEEETLPHFKVDDTSKKESSTYKNGDRLTDLEEKYFRKGICPDCLKKMLALGPSGGGSQNYYCLYEDCGSRFNDMSPFSTERISDASPKVQKFGDSSKFTRYD